MEQFTYSSFLKRFSTEEKCLEEIKNLRFPNGITCPKCKKVTNFYKLKRRKAYSCEFCRTQVYPLKDSIFEKTTTPLQYWLYVMYSMIQTKAGMSAKQIQRELGVTYKTAWRMAHQIRKLMNENDGGKLGGDVEIDETYIGGKGINRAKTWHGNEKLKEPVMGLVQRNGKAIMTRMDGFGKPSYLEPIKQYVSPKARLFTDENHCYYQLKKEGFNHYSINHKEHFRVGEVHTQNAENLWSHLKRGIYGTYRHVSPKHLQKYVDEFAYRYNHRKEKGAMFNVLLSQLSSKD
jgi:transposase-like protein